MIPLISVVVLVVLLLVVLLLVLLVVLLLVLPALTLRMPGPESGPFVKVESRPNLRVGAGGRNISPPSLLDLLVAASAGDLRPGSGHGAEGGSGRGGYYGR